MKSVIVFYLVLTGTSLAFAEESMSELPTIKVIGKTEKEFLSTPSSASNIEQERIKIRQPVGIQDAVSTTAGVNTVDTDGNGFFPKIGIRGLDPIMSRKVLLLEDGAPINLGPYTDPSSYYSPTLERMQRIEILKGSSSLRYGPSTIGGTINFITKDPKDVKNSYTLFGGSRENKGILLEGAKSLENSAFSTTFGKRSGEGNRENNGFNITDLIVKYGLALNDKHYASVKFGFYQNDLKATYLGLTQKMYDQDAFQNPAKNDDMKIRRISFDVNHYWSIKDNLELNTLLYSNTTNRDWWRENFTLINGNSEIQMSGTTVGRLREFNNFGIDSRLKWTNEFFGFLNKTEVGIRIHVEEMLNQQVNGITATSRSGTIRDDDIRTANAQALYFLNTITLGDFDITPGLRVESYKQRRHILRASDVDVNESNYTNNTELMPGLGIVYHLSEISSGYFGIHKGFSPPRVEDSINSSGATIDLKAERSVNTEIGVRRVSQDFSYDFALFQLDFENQLIQSSQAGGATSELTNAGRSIHQGAELAFDYHLVGPFYVSANWTYVPTAKLNSRRDIGGQNRDGNRLPYAPENIGSLGFEFRNDKWSGELRTLYTSKQFTDFENTQEGSADGRKGVIPDRTVWNIAGRAKINKDYDFFASVKNVMDEKYISSRAPQGIFPGLQRSFNLGVTGYF